MSDILERKRQNAGDAGYHWVCTAFRMEPNLAFVINSVYLTYGLLTYKPSSQELGDERESVFRGLRTMSSSKKFRTVNKFLKTYCAVDDLTKAYPSNVPL
jgi:hypothetical protein